MRRFFTWALPVLLLLICVPLVLVPARPDAGRPGGSGGAGAGGGVCPPGGSACYALEGAYPQDQSHLEERYGVSVDADRFRVDYIYIASNLMPDITIVPLSGA